MQREKQPIYSRAYIYPPDLEKEQAKLGAGIVSERYSAWTPRGPASMIVWAKLEEWDNDVSGFKAKADREFEEYRRDCCSY